MSKDSYYPQAYINSKGQISKHYVWASKVDGAVFKCPHTGERLTYQEMYEEPEVAAPGIKTMTKSAIVMDRRKRSTAHFKKEILPSFAKGSDEAIHFGKKYKKKS